jgi:hypothetical protein
MVRPALEVTLKRYTAWFRIYIEKVIAVQLVKKFFAFMETVGSLTCSESPNIGLYPQLIESNSHSHTLAI